MLLGAEPMKRWEWLVVAVFGCGGAVDAGEMAPTEATRPTPPAAVVPSLVPDGDCRTTERHGPVRLFTPWIPGVDRRGGHLEGGRLIRSGSEVFAVLMSPPNATGRSELGIYGGSGAEPFRLRVADVGEAGPLFRTNDLYWAQRIAASPGSPVRIARRGADDRPAPIANTDNDFGYVVDGGDAYTFRHEWCPTTTGCPPPVTITRVALATGTKVWSRGFDRSGRSPVVANGSLFWCADDGDELRLFRMPVDGGEPNELRVEIDPRDVNLELARDEAGLVLFGIAARDADGSAEVVRYRLPFASAAGSRPERVVLGRTYVGSVMVFDRSSVYFTYEGPLVAGRNQTQTLARACLDGSRPTVLFEGVSINAASTHLDAPSIGALAIDDTHVYFTSNNGVYAIEK